MCLRRYSSYNWALICHRSSKGGVLPDIDQMALLRQLGAEPRYLNDCTACHIQANQVSTWPGDQSRSGVLKGMINLLQKPDERLYFNILAAKEKLSTMWAEGLNQYKLKKFIK